MKTAVLLSCLAIGGSCAASVPVAANWDFWIFSRQVTLDGDVRRSFSEGSSVAELRGRYTPTREGARTYLDDGAKWSVLYAANRTLLGANPLRLLPGTVLTLPK